MSILNSQYTLDINITCTGLTGSVCSSSSYVRLLNRYSPQIQLNQKTLDSVILLPSFENRTSNATNKNLTSSTVTLKTNTLFHPRMIVVYFPTKESLGNHWVGLTELSPCEEVLLQSPGTQIYSAAIYAVHY